MPKLSDRKLTAVRHNLGGQEYQFLLTWDGMEEARRRKWVNAETPSDAESAEEAIEAAQSKEDMGYVPAIVATALLPFDDDATPELVKEHMHWAEIIAVFRKVMDTQTDAALQEHMEEIRADAKKKVA